MIKAMQWFFTLSISKFFTRGNLSGIRQSYPVRWKCAARYTDKYAGDNDNGKVDPATAIRQMPWRVTIFNYAQVTSIQVTDIWVYLSLLVYDTAKLRPWRGTEKASKARSYHGKGTKVRLFDVSELSFAAVRWKWQTAKSAHYTNEQSRMLQAGRERNAKSRKASSRGYTKRGIKCNGKR